MQDKSWVISLEHELTAGINYQVKPVRVKKQCSSRTDGYLIVTQGEGCEFIDCKVIPINSEDIYIKTVSQYIEADESKDVKGLGRRPTLFMSPTSALTGPIRTSFGTV